MEIKAWCRRKNWFDYAINIHVINFWKSRNVTLFQCKSQVCLKLLVPKLNYSFVCSDFHSLEQVMM